MASSIRRADRSSVGRIAPWAHLDVHREQRTGIPEIVLAEGKETPHLVAIVREFVKTRGRAIVSRVSAEQVKALRPLGRVEHHERARLAVVRAAGRRSPARRRRTGGRVCILGAGTSDFAVGEEARIVAEEFGCTVSAYYDVGVAGLHRLFETLAEPGVADADVFIVAAGRDGALPSVVSGLVDSPVIGLPVSTGYGVGGAGEAALHAMLQACSPLAVVNVDAGVVAGAVAAQIARRAALARQGARPREA